MSVKLGRLLKLSIDFITRNQELYDSRLVTKVVIDSAIVDKENNYK